jgi:hypothetical protein
MRKRALPIFVLMGLLIALVGQTAASGNPPLTAELAGLEFLVGHWTGGVGTLPDSGGTSSGSSTITIEANGTALLRKDHTDLFDVQGKPSGGFDQIMLIYAEQGQLRADYSDGRHVIHYPTVVVQPGKSATFISLPAEGATFKLSYELASANVLNVSFSTQPPGQSSMRLLAAGTLKKAQ